MKLGLIIGGSFSCCVSFLFFLVFLWVRTLDVPNRQVSPESFHKKVDPTRFKTTSVTGKLKQLSLAYFKLLSLTESIAPQPSHPRVQSKLENTTIPDSHVQPPAHENSERRGQEASPVLPAGDDFESKLPANLGEGMAHNNIAGPQRQKTVSISESLCQLCCTQKSNAVFMSCGHGGNSTLIYSL